MPNLTPLLAKLLATSHTTIYKLSGGKLGDRLVGMPVLFLTTTGRRSGEPRTTPLTYLEDGDDLVIVASYGGEEKHPAWYLNLTADPAVGVERHGLTEARGARTATAEERAVLWPRAVAAYSGYAGYQRRTAREIPMVILERR
ncbi:MAG: nitroreductase family deazaflavin-dependent oxidoreductase [Actinomycetota bacterium]|nr:nitroreductase family deazaflavin-dependent oxidoreductase [Actinomycetota bacterium]